MKLYEKVIYNQLSDYSDSFLNNILHGFRKAQSMQHALCELLQSWQQVLGNGVFTGTTLMDLSIAYNWIHHNLLIAKLEYYGVDKASLRLLLDYFTRRKQRSRPKQVYHLALSMILIQRSILGPLLFTVFINGLFLSIKKSEVCNFADDNTLLCGEKNLDLVFFSILTVIVAM